MLKIHFYYEDNAYDDSDAEGGASAPSTPLAPGTLEAFLEEIMASEDMPEDERELLREMNKDDDVIAPESERPRLEAVDETDEHLPEEKDDAQTRAVDWDSELFRIGVTCRTLGTRMDVRRVGSAEIIGIVHRIFVS